MWPCRKASCKMLQTRIKPENSCFAKHLRGKCGRTQRLMITDVDTCGHRRLFCHVIWKNAFHSVYMCAWFLFPLLLNCWRWMLPVYRSLICLIMFYYGIFAEDGWKWTMPLYSEILDCFLNITADECLHFIVLWCTCFWNLSEHECLQFIVLRCSCLWNIAEPECFRL